MKKFLALFLAILMVVSMVACGSKDAPAADAPAADAPAADAPAADAPAADEPIVLTWAVFETNNYTAEFYQHIIDTFEADYPNIKIEKVLMTGDSRPQFLKTMMSAGNMPDINIDPVELATEDGVYAEVPEEVLAQFDDSAIVEFNGKKTLIPAYTALRAQVYYNTEYFANAGIEKFPETKEEFTAACQKLADAGYVPLITSGAKDIWATSFGFFTNYVNSEIYTAYPNFNKDLLEGKVSFNNPVMLEALTYWQELANAGYYHKGSMSFGYAQASEEFLNGAAAMMIDGSWVAPGIDAGTNEYAKANISCAPFPTTEKVYCTMPQYWAVSETCENKEAAFTFCKYVLGGNKELYEYYLKADGVYSITKDPVAYDQGPMQTLFARNFDDYTLVPEIVKLPGDYSLPAGMEDFMNKSMQNIFTGADVATELDTWDAELANLMS